MDSTKWDLRAVPVVFCTDTAHALAEMRAALPSAARVAVDTETVVIRDADGNIVKRDLDVDGPGPWRVMSVAARFDTPQGSVYRAWVLDMAHVDPVQLNEPFDGIRPDGWNAPFDRTVLLRAGLNVRHWQDAMIKEAVLRQGAYYAAGERPWYLTLDTAAQTYLGFAPMAGKSDTRLGYDMTTPLTDEQIRYAADDATVTLWVAEELDERLAKAGLTQTAERSCRAQNFVKAMKVNGFPFAGDDYRAVVAEHQAKADAAAERIAVMTGGLDVLRTLVRWGIRTGAVTGDGADPARVDTDAEYVIETGLPLLHDAATMATFLEDVADQRARALASLAEVLDAGEPVDDLFSEQKRYDLPFNPDDETTIRRWINKNAKQFVAEFLASVGSTTRGLTKEHDLAQVYARMREQPGDVTEQLAQAAVYLEAYARYGKILADYGQARGVVRLRPTWNLGSVDQVRDALNTYAQDAVLAYTQATEGSARLLGKADSINATALKLIGGPLAAALLDYREHEKMVSTYGDGLLQFIHPRTGRVHASYAQELTATGRLASSSPNAQNLSPEAKPFITAARRLPDGTLAPAHEGGPIRVLVTADLSQAELRFLANIAEDENMLAAFRSGEDLHVRTASLMFGLDLKALAANGSKTLAEMAPAMPGLDEHARANPQLPCKDLYKQLRQKAKAVSFGYAYGLGAASLATSLTVQGVPTTVEQAQDLLRKFDEAYPQVAAWMGARRAFIEGLAEAMCDQSKPSGVDFEASWQLHRLYSRAWSSKKALQAALERTPTPREIAEHMVPDAVLQARLTERGLTMQTPEWDAAWEEIRTGQAEQVQWALGHFGSAMLTPDGPAWSFESRNSNGRRRIFQVGTADWVMSMVACVARSRRTYARNLTKAWETAHNEQVMKAYEEEVAAGRRRARPKLVHLTKEDPRSGRSVPLTFKELEKAMEDRALRESFVSFVLSQYDQLPNAALARDYLFRHAMADQIKGMANRYRNHPIQSGVGDAVLEAFYRIDEECHERFPTALAIQSVHDSITLECDLTDAKAVKEMLVRHMEAALQEMCPHVPAKADGKILISLDESTELSDEDVDRLLGELAQAA